MSGILVIDNDPLVRSTLRAVLERDGHQVHEASNGIQGVRDFPRYSPDLVITDIVMPGKDGLDTIRELLGLLPCLKIIAMTGSDPDNRHGYLKLAGDLGAARTFSKPFDVKALTEAVRELLSG
jgi:two-component system, chemotaxis family, chemotaxis protein CheY